MKYALSALAAVVLLVGGRAVEDRWKDEFQSAPVRLKLIEHKLGNWEGRDLQLEGQQASWAQLGDGSGDDLGYIDRDYVDTATGKHVSILLVWGRPDPISQHTPDQCYPSAGFTPANDKVREAIDAEAPRSPAEFYVQDFAKSGPDSARLRIYWAWNADGRWQAPEDPHEALGRHRQYYTYGGGVLFKLYVIREVTGEDGASDADASKDFLRVLLPEFRRQLFPGT
jgi:hypothetical protein